MEKGERSAVKKYTLFIFLLCTLQLVGCGKKETKEIKEEKKAVTETQKQTKETAEPTLKAAGEFSDGIAWVDTGEEKWCIDTEGKKIFEYECTTADPFVNGYSVVDGDRVIDKTGELVYNWKEEGYSLEDTRALEAGIIILSKNIDTYDKSGTFYYVLNLEKKEISEVDFQPFACYEENGVTNILTLDDYLGNGYYTVKVATQSIFNNRCRLYEDKLQLYDTKGKQMVEIQIPEASNAEFDSYSTEDYKSAYFVLSRQLGKLDLSTLDYSIIVENIPFSADVALHRENIFEIYYEGAYFFYDISNEEYFPFKTKYDDKIEDVLAYKNGNFILRLKNDIESEYIAVVDKKGNTLMEPAKFEYDVFTPQFVGDGMVYFNEDITYFVNTKTWEVENQFEARLSHFDPNDDDDDLDEKEYQAQNGYMPEGDFGDDKDGSDIRCCEDRGTGYVFINTGDGDGAEAVYTGFTSLGEKIFENISLYPGHYSEGFIVMGNLDSEEAEIWDTKGEALSVFE